MQLRRQEKNEVAQYKNKDRLWFWIHKANYTTICFRVFPLGSYSCQTERRKASPCTTPQISWLHTSKQGVRLIKCTPHVSINSPRTRPRQRPNTSYFLSDPCVLQPVDVMESITVAAVRAYTWRAFCTYSSETLNINAQEHKSRLSRYRCNNLLRLQIIWTVDAQMFQNSTSPSHLKILHARSGRFS